MSHTLFFVSLLSLFLVLQGQRARRDHNRRVFNSMHASGKAGEVAAWICFLGFVAATVNLIIHIGSQKG